MDDAMGLWTPVLHGITAVAELKLLIAVVLDPLDWGSPRHHRRGRIEALNPKLTMLLSPMVLHGITAVAELKQLLRPRLPPRRRVLHGITAVAELKQGFVLHSEVPCNLFSTASPPWPN